MSRNPDPLAVAYAYLNRRERTEAEVRTRLQKAEFDDAQIQEVVDELLEFGYIDDARYATVFAQDKRALEQWGTERIKRSLHERGINRDVVTAALRELDRDSDADAWDAGGGGRDAHDEHGQALELLRRRFPASPSDGSAGLKDRDRAFGLLIRKGYDSDLASDVVRAWAKS